MKFFSAYHGVAPRYDLLDRLGLEEKRRTKYSQLSTGQQRRLALSLAVAHDPPVIILDEPTAGLDVATRAELHALMQELRAQGARSSATMTWRREKLRSSSILLRGKIVATGSPIDLTATGSGFTKVSVRTEQSMLEKNGANFPAVAKKSVLEDYVIYFSSDPGPTVSAIMDYIHVQGDKLIDLRVERPTLEERFLEITNLGDAQ
jgi:ABC-2 type transport system ATP-binding protein